MTGPGPTIDEFVKKFSSEDRLTNAAEILNNLKIEKIENKIRGVTLSGRTLTQFLDLDTGKFFCDCEDFQFRKVACKHILALLMNVSASEPSLCETFLKKSLSLEPISVIKPSDYISTGCDVIDGLLLGGIPRSVVFGIEGPSKVGKTWFCQQVAHRVKTYYIDTEQFFVKDEIRSLYDSYFEKRFGKKSEIKYEFVRSLESLCAKLGLKVNIETSTGGKIDVKIWDDEERLKVFSNDLKIGGYELLVIDSLTMIVKRSVPVPPNQNMPARSALINKLWGCLEKLLEDNPKLSIILTHHTSVAPDSYAYYGEPWGGDTIMYNTKYLLVIAPPDKQIRQRFGERSRRIIRKIYPGLEEESVVVKLEKDYGYKEV